MVYVKSKVFVSHGSIACYLKSCAEGYVSAFVFQ